MACLPTLTFAMLTPFAVLCVEIALCRPGLRWSMTPLLGRIDLFYFGAAMLPLASGLARVFFGLKGSAFYLQNPVFYTKITLFLVVALISIAPTIQVIRWARQFGAYGDEPVGRAEVMRANRFIQLELAVFVLIPLFATLMARGFGN